MRKHSKVLIAVVLSLSFSLNFGLFQVSANEGIEPFAEWKTSNGQDYLYIEANNHYELGLLKGSYLVEKIYGLRLAIEGFGQSFGVSYEQILMMASQYDAFIPDEYREEFTGIADGVCLVLGNDAFTYSDVLVQNVFFDILLAQVIPMTAMTQSPVGCSAMGVIEKIFWFKYPIVMQNFDFTLGFEVTLSFVHAVTPDFEYFALNMGSVVLPTGKNGHGVNFVINVVQSNVYRPANSYGSGVLIRRMLEKSISAKDALNYVEPLASFNLMISDHRSLYALQVNSNEVLVEKVSTFAVRTNTYVEESWQQYLVDPLYSKDRQEYITETLDENYLNLGFIRLIDPEAMREILRDSPLVNRETTMAFYDSTGYFGLGNYQDSPAGIIPF